ncbi:MAG: NUDIX domain-containing protein [Oscillospiraceae bacterium]|jgi:ADP-ribose pyrophosphatase YjhB (NUDIX family)|nr:NUDIX domain-containing protein [Oscillospiraceae bacterium]
MTDIEQQDNYFAGVGGICVRDGKVLLVRHTYGAANSRLLIPGGYMKFGELPQDAVKREIYEETGVTVEVGGLIAVRCEPQGWYLAFIARYVSGEPRSDGAENSAAAFFDCAEVLRRSDVTNTSLELVRLALTREPIEPSYIAPTDSAKNRVWFTSNGKEINDDTH